MPIDADIVICDAALGEMDHFAFRYIAQVSQALVARSDVGCFLYQNLGEERVHQRPFVEQYMTSLGFRVHHVGGVTLLVGPKFPEDSIRGLAEPPPCGGAHGMQSPVHFLPLDQQKLIESYAFFDFIGIGH